MIRPLAATLALALAYFGYEAWLDAGGARKLAGIEIPSPKGHYELRIAFPPEGFHVTRMQAIGRLIEVKAQGSLHANSGQVLVAAAEAGQGIVLETDFHVAQALQARALVRVLP